jgi:hypothetical protein
MAESHQYRDRDHQHWFTTDSLDDQGEALKRHFNAVIAACELPVPRGELKNRIKTFLGNPLMRGVDGPCTKLGEECAEMTNSMQGWESAINNGSELLAHYSDQCRVFEEQNKILVRDNEGPEDLQFYMVGSMLAGTSLRQQQEGVPFGRKLDLFLGAHFMAL